MTKTPLALPTVFFVCHYHRKNPVLMTKFIKSSVNLQRTRISNFNNIFMKKPSLIILLVLLSCQLFGQTLKTTIDNNLLGQGIRGVSALKVRNVLSVIVDSIRTKYNVSGGTISGSVVLPYNTSVGNIGNIQDAILSKSKILVTNVETNGLSTADYSTYDYIFDTSLNRIYKYQYNEPPLIPNLVLIGESPTYDDLSAKANLINPVFSGITTAEQYKLTAMNTAPYSANSPGFAGEIRITATHIYVCVATNNWTRVALSTW